MALIPKNVNNLHEFGPQPAVCNDTIDDEDGNSILDEEETAFCEEAVAKNTSFVFKIFISDATFELPLPELDIYDVEYYSYNFVVDWGDGSATDTITAYNDADRFHFYEFEGTYTITITGVCEGISFDVDIGSSEFASNVVEVVNWGSTGFISCYSMFYGCDNLATISATDGPVLASTCVDLSYMFSDCPFTSIDVSEWDVSTITLMYSAFSGTSISSGGFSNWDVSNVTEFSDMFYSASSFNEDLSGWDVSSGQFFSYMFAQTLFNQDVSDWNVSEAETFNKMFGNNVMYGSLSTANYDLLLEKWALLTFTDTGNKPFGADSTYTLGGAAEAGRTTLAASPRNFIFTDNGGI